jgi:hypothetical protein
MSTQCCPLGIAHGSDSSSGLVGELLATSFKVEAGPITFGWSFAEPVNGEVGAYGTGRAISTGKEPANDKLTDVSKITCVW